jgi:uncharacterized protein YbjT (DUF2867 family)
MARVLILGGAGFIGRHAWAALKARGYETVVGTRRPCRAKARFPAPGDRRFREAHFERLTSPSHWDPLLHEVDMVVNAVGIMRERGAATYERVHCTAPAALASACGRRGIRLIHISALGLHAGARSRFLTSKLRGEAAISASNADYTIVRPSLLDGEGGFGARWLRWLARFPVHFVPATACGRIAALDVRDLGEAIAALCDGAAVPREVELGGLTQFTMAEYLAILRAAHTSRPAWTVRVPAWAARIGSHLCDLGHFSPFSFGHLELMQRDNAPKNNLLPYLLGRRPSNIGGLATPGRPGRSAAIPGAAGRA